MTPEIITSDGYRIRFDPEQPHDVQITNNNTGDAFSLTFEEAINLLRVMLKNQAELGLIKSGL